MTQYIAAQVTDLQSQTSISEPNAGEAAKSNADEMQLLDIHNTWGQFSGNLNELHRFSKRFKANIHENGVISSQKKFMLLKQACVQNALDIVNSSGEQYEQAWSKLNNTYGEAYLQIHYCIHRIQTMRKIEHPTSEEMKRLLKHGKQCMTILGEAIKDKEYDVFLMAMFASKLDDGTSRAWDRHRAALAESWAKTQEDTLEKSQAIAMHVPAWDDFASFLESEADLFMRSEMRPNLETTTNSQYYGNAPSTSSYAQNDFQYAENASCSSNALNVRDIAPNNLHKISTVHPQQVWSEEKRQAPRHLQCTLCPIVHPRYKCDMYQIMSYDHKWQHVQKEGLCKSC